MKITFAAVAMILFTGAVFAETINIQNANFIEAKSKVVVSGKLTGFEKSNHVVIKDSLTGELLVELTDIKKNFIAQIDRGEGQAIPCSVTVTSGGASVSRDVRSAPADCSNRFTLSGLVTDSILPYAIVVVHVGGQTFTTVADENGFYFLDIATASVDDLVTIEAEAENDETITLVNSAGTFSELWSDPAENVTNVTTAQYNLLIEANGDEPPTSEQELRDAETLVDATRLLELAAVTKLIVDDPEYSLPDGFESIVSFIADEPAVDQFIADVNANDPNAITDTILAILEDNDLVDGYTAAEVPSFYYAIPRANPGWLAHEGNSYEFDGSTFNGTLFSAEAGGSGLPISEEFTWEVTDGVLELSFTDPASFSNVLMAPEYVTTDQALIDEFYLCRQDPNKWITMHYRRWTSSLTRVVDGSLVDIASRTDRVERWFDPVPTIYDPDDSGCTGDPIEFDTVFEFETYEVTLRSSDDITPIPFTDGLGGVDVLGSWAFNYYYNPGADLYNPAARRVLSNLLTFNPDGSGSKLFDDEDLTDQTFSWQIVGNDLVISYPDGWTQTSRILDQEGKQYGVFHDFTNGTDRFANYEIAFKQDPTFTFTETDLPSPPGKFWNSAINHWIPDWNFVDGNWTFTSHWGWDFKLLDPPVPLDPLLNGTNLSPYWFDGQRYWSAFPMTWEIHPGGMLQITYLVPIWGGGGAFERQRFWTPLAEDPITEDPVTGESISPIRRFYVFEYEDQAPDRRIQPRINIQQEADIPEYDMEEFCKYVDDPEPEWNCTVTPYTQ